MGVSWRRSPASGVASGLLPTHRAPPFTRGCRKPTPGRSPPNLGNGTTPWNPWGDDMRGNRLPTLADTDGTGCYPLFPPGTFR